MIRTAVVLAPGQSRSGELLHVVGDVVVMKLAGRDTGGRYAVAEEITPPGGGPPLHVHHREDECFYVLEGEYVFEVGGEKIQATAGTFLFGPREIPHTFRNVGNTSGRILVTMEPAGLENLFEELAAAAPSPADMGAILPLFRKYGLELLGPQLASRKA